MKYLFLGFLMFFLFAGTAKAQTNYYHSFPDSNAIWGMTSGCFDHPTGSSTCNDWAYVRNYFAGDTIINGLDYKKINEDYLMMTNGNCCFIPTSLGSGYLRDDTVAHKVYWYFPSLNVDSLLYDFSLQPGDTLQGYFASYVGTITVLSVDSIFIENSYRKRINLDTSDNCAPFSIIEGIGSTTGLTFCEFGQTERGSVLQCFSKNGNIIYTAPCGADTVPCGTLPVNVNHIEYSAFEEIELYPNPANSILKIRLNSGETIKEIRIIDLLGIVRISYLVNGDQYEMDISALLSALYILQITSGSGKISSGKIVKD